MTGSPLIQLAGLSLGLMALLIPLRHLTQDSPAHEMVPASGSSQATTPTTLRLQCAHPPQSLTFSELGKVLYTSTSPDLLQTTELNLHIPTAGVECSVEATWSTGTPPTPITVTLTPEGLREQSQTLWSEGPTLQGVAVWKW
jgi:hypothetical protein